MKALERLKNLWELSDIVLQEARKMEASKERKQTEAEPAEPDLSDLDWDFGCEDEETITVILPKSVANDLKKLREFLGFVEDKAYDWHDMILTTHQHIIRQLAEQQGMGPEDERGCNKCLK